MEKMNMNEKRRQLVRYLRQKIVEVRNYQDRPWTMVVVRVDVSGLVAENATFKIREAFGFSKVCRPDKWDAAYGTGMALTKALNKLAKELIQTL